MAHPIGGNEKFPTVQLDFEFGKRKIGSKTVDIETRHGLNCSLPQG